MAASSRAVFVAAAVVIAAANAVAVSAGSCFLGAALVAGDRRGDGLVLALDVAGGLPTGHRVRGARVTVVATWAVPVAGFVTFNGAVSTDRRRRARAC